jgi:CheY-like chemotaxis protein
MAKILIVEDDEAQQFLYHVELVEEGYEVVLAKNGVEALKCLEESPFDLIVLDIRMPIMNGIEFLGKISGRYGEPPVIIHTAYPEYRSQFISLMAGGFVLKSADLSLLKNTIKDLLKKKKN